MNAPPTVHAADLETVELARIIRDGETVFVGVNSPLPMAACLLAREMHAPNSTLLTIAGGINPSPRVTTAATSSAAFAAGSASILDNLAFYDLVARGDIDRTFLGGAQIDRLGNVNSSFIGSQREPKVRLPGGGGAAFILPLAHRVAIWRASHDRRIFVDTCEFVTAAGNLDRVLTPLCTFERVDGALSVRSIHPGVDPGHLRDATGFDVDLESCRTTEPPTAEELEVLRRIDPRGIRYSEFQPESPT